MVAHPSSAAAAALAARRAGPAAGGGGGGPITGRYCVRGAAVACVVVYPNSRSTEIRSRLALRSTKPGANDRRVPTPLPAALAARCSSPAPSPPLRRLLNTSPPARDHANTPSIRPQAGRGAAVHF